MFLLPAGPISKTAWCHSAEDHSVNTHCRENLKSSNTHLTYQTLWFGTPAHLFRAEFNFCKTVFSLFPPMRSLKNWNHILPAHVRVNQTESCIKKCSELILLLVSVMVLRVKKYGPRYWSCGIHGRLVWYWWRARVKQHLFERCNNFILFGKFPEYL
jgi:hypothetical protein